MVSIAEMEGRAREEDEETVGMKGWNRDEDKGDCTDHVGMENGIEMWMKETVWTRQ